MQNPGQGGAGEEQDSRGRGQKKAAQHQRSVGSKGCRMSPRLRGRSEVRGDAFWKERRPRALFAICIQSSNLFSFNIL